MTDTNVERITRLSDLGLLFDGKYESFVYEDINFHWTDIVCMSNEQFDKAYEGAVNRMKILKTRKRENH